MAEIRRARPEDIEALIEMGRALHAESPNYEDEPFEPEVLRAWLHERLHAGTLLTDNSAVFVAEQGGSIVGVLVAIVVPRWFNRSSIAAELTLYVAPAHRGGRTLPKLARAFEAWARKQGAVSATLGVSTGIHAERTVCAYSKLGYRLDGYNATKML